VTDDGAANTTRRPRLLHVTTTDISLELLLGPQLEAFDAAGYEVIGVSAPGEFVDAIEARGIQHIALRNATRSMDPRRDIAAIGELHGLFRNLKPTIVHTHNPKPGLYGRIAAGTARVPVVVNTVHGLYALPEDNWKKRAIVYTLERLASVFSDAELVQNPEDLVTLRRVLREPTSKLTLLGNGVDLARFGRDRFDDPAESAGIRSRIRDEIGAHVDTVVVGAVGRLVLEKGYAELLEAWDAVHCSHPEALLVIAGPVDAAKADALPDATIERAERSGVSFLGMRDDVEDLYLGLDLYVLASHREGFPRSAMEAAASGLPIVATDIRGCRQVVSHDRNGLLVPVRSARGLAEAITRLVADPGRRQNMAATAVARAREDFDQQRVIERTLATYERLLTAAGIDPPEPNDG
jgi:glycosyltransferase involved in cell wall biosynthesis